MATLGLSHWVWFLAAVQFIVWLKPSEAFFVDLVVQASAKTDFPVTYTYVSNSVFPLWTDCLVRPAAAAVATPDPAPPQAPATFVVAVLFVTCGSKAALLLTGFMVAATPTLVRLWVAGVWPSHAALKASQGSAALGFAVAAVVSTTMFTLAPSHKFQRVASVSRGTILLSSMLSALVGQGIVGTHAHHLKLSHIITTLDITLVAGTVAALMCVVYASCAPSLDLQQLWATAFPDAPNTATVAGKAAHAARQLFPRRAVLWAGWRALVFAVHTLVLTNWSTLFEGIDDSVANGYVEGSAYAAGVIATIVPSMFEGRDFRSPGWPFVFSLGAAVSGGLLWLMASSSTLGAAWACFVAYNAVAEGVLVVTSSQISKTLYAASVGPDGATGEDDPHVRQARIRVAMTLLATSLVTVCLQLFLQNPVLRQQVNNKHIYPLFRDLGAILLVAGTASVAGVGLWCGRRRPEVDHGIGYVQMGQ